MELINALGVKVIADFGEKFSGELNEPSTQLVTKMRFEQVHPPNIVGIMDGCADISVVTTGTLSALGLADASVLNEVNRSNLSKFGPGGHKREDGKWIKGPDYSPADFAKILETQRACCGVAVEKKETVSI